MMMIHCNYLAIFSAKSLLDAAVLWIYCKVVVTKSFLEKSVTDAYSGNQ